MQTNYPTYKYIETDPQNGLVRFVKLDNTGGYAFGHFHAHEYNEILVFITGGGNHNINSTNYTIEHNSIHMLSAHDLHLLEPSGVSTGFAIAYKDQLLQKLQILNSRIDYFTTFNCSRIINLNSNEAKEFEFIFREILKNDIQPPYMLSLIGAFITKIASLDHKEPPMQKTYDPIVGELLRLVEQNYKSKTSISDYARKLNLTPRTLQNRFKKVSSITIHKLLQQRRLKEAKKLLDASRMNVSEISTELGFKEPAHFSNWFKKLANCVPLGYKYRNA